MILFVRSCHTNVGLDCFIFASESLLDCFLCKTSKLCLFFGRPVRSPRTQLLFKCSIKCFVSIWYLNRPKIIHNSNVLYYLSIQIKTSQYILNHTYLRTRFYYGKQQRHFILRLLLGNVTVNKIFLILF